MFYISWHPPAPYLISSCVMSLLYEVKTPESLYLFLFYSPWISLVDSIEVGRHLGILSPWDPPTYEGGEGLHDEAQREKQHITPTVQRMLHLPREDVPSWCIDWITPPSLFKSHKVACPWNQQEPDGERFHKIHEKKKDRTNANAYPWYHGNSHRVFCGCKINCPRDRRQAVKNRREALLHPAVSPDWDNESLNTMLNALFTLRG